MKWEWGAIKSAFGLDEWISHAAPALFQYLELHMRIVVGESVHELQCVGLYVRLVIEIVAIASSDCFAGHPRVVTTWKHARFTRKNLHTFVLAQSLHTIQYKSTPSYLGVEIIRNPFPHIWVSIFISDCTAPAPVLAI